MLIGGECNSVSRHKVRVPLYARSRSRVQIHCSVAEQQASCHSKVCRNRKKHTVLISFGSAPPWLLCETSLGVSCFGGVGTTAFIGGLGYQVRSASAKTLEGRRTFGLAADFVTVRWNRELDSACSIF